MSKLKWMLLFAILSVVATIFLILRVSDSKSLVLDDALNHLMLSLFSEASYPFFNVITELGDTIGIVIVAFSVAIWLIVKKRDFIGAAILILAVGLGNETNKWVKEVVGRERPETAQLAESLSFPSGHAMVGVILYFLSTYLIIKHIHSFKLKWRIALISFVIVFLIGLSRIVLQDHYPTDVLGGYSIGLIWSIVWILLYSILCARIEARFLKKGTRLNQ